MDDVGGEKSERERRKSDRKRKNASEWAISENHGQYTSTTNVF